MATTWSSSKFDGRAPDGHVLLRSFLGRAGREAAAQLDDDEMAAVVRSELREIMGITRGARVRPDLPLATRHAAVPRRPRRAGRPHRGRRRPRAGHRARRRRLPRHRHRRLPARGRGRRGARPRARPRPARGRDPAAAAGPPRRRRPGATERRRERPRRSGGRVGTAPPPSLARHAGRTPEARTCRWTYAGRAPRIAHPSRRRTTLHRSCRPQPCSPDQRRDSAPGGVHPLEQSRRRRRPHRQEAIT